MKRLIASLTLAAGAALVVPMAFPKAVQGCSNPDYVYNTSSGGDKSSPAAKLAKTGFCKTVKFYN